LRPLGNLHNKAWFGQWEATSFVVNLDDFFDLFYEHYSLGLAVVI
jgi:hypothetical protein